LAEALDRLYGGPHDEFLARRKELAAGLRAAGHAAAARELAAFPKPTLTAWALDEVVRRRPELLRAAIAGREAAALMHKAGEAEQLRDAVRDDRSRLGEVLDAAREILVAAGHEPNVDQVRRMAETLRAVVAEPSESRSLLLAGQLARDVEQDDPLAGLEAGPPRIGPGRRSLPPPPKDDERQRARFVAELTAAEETVRELENALRCAHSEAREAEVAASRARDEADRKRRAADELAARLGNARDVLGARKARTETSRR